MFHVYQLATLAYKLELTRNQAQIFEMKLEVQISTSSRLKDV